MSSQPSASLVANGPVIHVRVNADGQPTGAATIMRIAAPPGRVWAVLSDVERFTGRLPMVDRARRRGDLVEIELKFRMGFFSAGFTFTASISSKEPEWLELRWVSGEPRGVKFRFTVTPIEDGRASIVEGESEFEVQSLGWLVKYFLKHHPEIQHGIFPGVSLVMVDTLRRVVTLG